MSDPGATKGPGRFKLLGAVSLVIVILDQITKAVVQQHMALHETIPVIQSFFHLTYIRNPGAAFGMFAQADSSIRTVFFILITLAALAFLAHLYAKLPAGSSLGRVSVSLIMGGALGNLIDRIRFGEVTDFLDFFIGQYHWPAFNVADSAISVGVGFLILFFIRDEKTRRSLPENQV